MYRKSSLSAVATAAISERTPIIVALLVLAIIPMLAVADGGGGGALATTTTRAPFRAHFKECCAQGRQAANESSIACSNYTNLLNKSGGCRYAFTICCNQNRHTLECDRGKKHAYAGLACEQLKKESTCDALTDCCNCCELGIQTRKNGEDCTTNPELNIECNELFMDCCKYATSYEDCRNSHFCPNGQICETTKDGPICKCPVGFEKKASHCIDIDECKKADVCPPGSTCQNTAGSYACTRSCGLGYVFDSQANQCKDINECITGTHDCVSGMRCENYPGSFRCIREKPCGTGYSVNVYTQDCDDLDECSLNLHDCAKGFICINVPGTYKCKPRECEHGYLFNYNTGECEKLVCIKGFEVDAKGKCADVDECQRYPDTLCHINERCDNTPGSYKCTLVLICEEGYELNANKTECIDIDECLVGRHTCPAQATCVNTLRSFKCECPAGYRLDRTRNICEDIDECAFGKVCPSNSYCRNAPGSFICECKQGFSLVSHLYHSCIDNDECLTPGICDHRCINTFGSYQCTCNEGYKLASDKKTCIDIDECSLKQTLCSGICKNTPGSYECSCAPGYMLDKKQRRLCEDIDECELKMSNCSDKDICVNTRGSFSCIAINCPEGYNVVGELKKCDRANVVCTYGDQECVRKPMKIFYSYSTFSCLVPVPVRIFTTKVNTYSRRIKFKHDLRLVSSTGSYLTSDQFMVKQTNNNVFDVYLLEQGRENTNVQLDLKIEFYTDSQFQSCLLNKIFVFMTD